MIRITCTAILAIAALLIATPGRAAEKAQPGAAEKEKPKKEKPDKIPIQGKISAVDQTAKTITLEGKEKNRTIYITSKTRITKAGKPATLDEAKAGEQVAGQVRKTAAGKEEVLSLRIGPKPEGAPKKEKKPKKEVK